MCLLRVILCLSLFLSGLICLVASEDVVHLSGHKLRVHRAGRRHRAAGNDGALRFEPKPFNKNMELSSSGKIHCKVAGGVSPTVQWFLNEQDPLPEGMTSVNGTLLVSEATQKHSGKYTCKATDGDSVITSEITLDVVVSPRILEPSPDSHRHVTEHTDVWINCLATGVPQPTTHWDRNLTILGPQQDGVEIEGSEEEATASTVLYNNGTLLLRNVSRSQSGGYGCTAGSPAGLVRALLYLHVYAEGEPLPQESTGVAGKAVLVSVTVAGAYMILVLALTLYCRRRRLKRRERGEKMELECVEGREKLVPVEEERDREKTAANGARAANGRVLQADSGADNSESCASRASKKSSQYELFALPRTLLTEQIVLGRGEFGEVMLAKIDINQVKRIRNKDYNKDLKDTDMRPILVKSLTTKDESQLLEFRRELELFSRVRQENIVRLIGLCNEQQPHLMLLETTDWGELKQFLITTRTAEEHEEYISRVGRAHDAECRPLDKHASPLLIPHAVLLASQLASANNALAHRRVIHKDIAARNCVISSRLQLKLSLPALTRGPRSHEYYKLHDQVIPLRWLPSEVVLEGDYSTKSDVYMFAATVWEIFTKGELPFAKLNDNSVVERIQKGSLEWTVPESMPDRLALLLKKCWSKSPAERPQFDKICDEITSILQDLTAETLAEKAQEKNNELAKVTEE